MTPEFPEKPVAIKEAMRRGRTKARLDYLDGSVDICEKKKGKPPYSYISLIVMAILESPNRRQTLSGIIEYIQKRFSYYGGNCPAKGWKNSIRHNLSLNDCFVKTFRDPTNPSKGHLWSLHPESTHMFEGGSFMRRKKRFRKHSAVEQEDSRDTSYDVTLTSYRDVHLTSHSDVSASAVGSRDAPIMPCSILEEDWSQEYSFLQQGVRMQTASIADCTPCGGGPGRVLFPSVPNASLCLICAGCTCLY